VSRFVPNRLAAPLAVAAGLRGTLWAFVLLRTGTRAMAGGDTLSYLEPGRNLLLHGVFQTAGLPEIGRAPGYPLFLAVASGAGLALAALLQAALSVLSVWLVARLARAVGLSEPAVLCAAWLAALEPVSILYSVRLLSETLFTALLLVSVGRMAAFLRTPLSRPVNSSTVPHPLRGLPREMGGMPMHYWKAGSISWSGLALAAAIFVRPAAYWLPMAWALGLAVVCWHQRGLRWKASALLLAATLPLLAAWQLRNWMETGFSGFSSIAVRNAYFYSAAETEARANGFPFAVEQQAFGYPDEAAYMRSHPEQTDWSQAARLSFQRAEAGRILEAHWPEALRAQVVGSAVVAFSPCAAELLELLDADSAPAPPRVVHAGPLDAALHILRTDPLRATVMVILELWLLALYLLAVKGTVRAGLPRFVRMLLIGTSLYFITVSGGVQAVGRYRMPVMPLVCVLAGAGLACKQKQARMQSIEWSVSSR